MNRIYIDFDGVILDTWETIFSEYLKKYDTTEIEDDKIKRLMLDIGWENILNESKVINNNLEKLKKINNDFDMYILTKFNSEEEKVIKEKYLINNKINNIIFIPYEKDKSQVVNPKSSILIDDEVNNLNNWNKKGGKSIFFNKELKNIDSYGNTNKNYQTINDLLKIYDII